MESASGLWFLNDGGGTAGLGLGGSCSEIGPGSVAETNERADVGAGFRVAAAPTSARDVAPGRTCRRTPRPVTERSEPARDQPPGTLRPRTSAPSPIHGVVKAGPRPCGFAQAGTHLAPAVSTRDQSGPGARARLTISSPRCPPAAFPPFSALAPARVRSPSQSSESTSSSSPAARSSFPRICELKASHFCFIRSGSVDPSRKPTGISKPPAPARPPP